MQSPTRHDINDTMLRNFAEALTELAEVQENIVPEPDIVQEEEEYTSKRAEGKKQRDEALRAMNAAGDDDRASDHALAAYQKAHNELKALELKRAQDSSRRNELRETNSILRHSEDALLRRCIKYLVELNPAFEKTIQPSWIPLRTSHHLQDLHEKDLDVPTSANDQSHAHFPQQSRTSARPEPTVGDGSPIDEDPVWNDDCATSDLFSDHEPAEATEIPKVHRARSQTLAVARHLSPELSTAPIRSPVEAANVHGRDGRKRTLSGTDAEVFEEYKRQKPYWDEVQMLEEASMEKDPLYSPIMRAPRRKQGDAGKDDLILKKVLSNSLVATRSITMAELASSAYQHHIYKAGHDSFYIFRCDVCGAHFKGTGLVGAIGHLQRTKQHASLRKTEGLRSRIEKRDVIRYMGIQVLGCSHKVMEKHNAALDRQGDRYVVPNATSADLTERNAAYHPERPVILLPRHQEKNRPRLSSSPTDFRETSRSSAAGVALPSEDLGVASPVKSDIGQPQSSQRPHGVVPGQIYWAKEQPDARHYRPALALPYRNLREIGLLDWDVSPWVDRMRIRFTYDQSTGYFKEKSNRRNMKDPERVYPVLFLDASDGSPRPKVAYPQLSTMRNFERDEIQESHPVYTRLIQYLDEATLWFVGDEEGRGTVGESSSVGVSPTTPRTAGLPETISISSSSDDDDDMPTLEDVINSTPTKPPSGAPRRQSKGKGLEVQNPAVHASGSNANTQGNPAISTGQDYVFEPATLNEPAPTAIM
ncbi:hypothetical protein NLU13_5082 [Sarocladium strictum]|uniref:Uncharacterized protein n=1 Tax=Sarocladium strictum TaxID=5046 RepID=A0AA39GLW0_SARSR|nr:hypothetical protein NLU13_5082 [Sarocladium strictum]